MKDDLIRQFLKYLQMKTILTVRKKMSFEPTGNADKIVIPNLRPFDAINMIAKKSLPEKSNGVGYYFMKQQKVLIFVVGITWYQ